MKTHHFLQLGLILALFVIPVQLRAQDGEESLRPNQASLTVHVDKRGAAKVSLMLQVAVSDQESLKRALAESWSFPVQFSHLDLGEEDSEETEQDYPWTFITAESTKAFSHSGLKSSCRINLQSLLPQLRSLNVESLKVLVLFENVPGDLTVAGAQRKAFFGTHVDIYEANVDLRAPALNVIDFTIGYSAGDILLKTIPLVVFLILPSLWTRRSVRKFGSRPEELWGRHLRFITRMLNVIWIVWLPVYVLSGLDGVVSFVFGPDRQDMAQLVNLTFYFVPPIVAMLLCHATSRKVYELVPSIEFSPRDVVRHSITVTTFSLAPLFLLILGINTFRTSARQAALYMVIGYIGWLILNHFVGKAFDPSSYAMAPGDLRDRIFELARKAGVLLKDAYVLPEDRAQLSNAFARSDDTVGVTNSVLRHLSRREVDAVMAHEIGHLQARHPHGSGTRTLLIVIGANVVGSLFAWMINLQQSTALVFSGALVLSSLAVFFISRRNERQADAIGVGLTGDPEAFISGLSKLTRLSLEPMHTGMWGESLDTHPRTMRRFQNIAHSHGISAERLEELVSDSDAPPENTYPGLDTNEGEIWVFSSEFKRKYRIRTALVLLAVMLFAPVPFAWLYVSGKGFLPILIALSGVFVSYSLVHVVRNRIAFWGQAPQSRKLRAKLEKRGLGDLSRLGTIVGLAPAAESRNYDGYPFWDVGVLWLTNEKLYYVGELTEFVLARDQVEKVYSENATPEWLPEKNLFLQWQKEGEPAKETLHFVAVGERSIWLARRAIDSLQEQLKSWRNKLNDFPSTQAGLESIVGPSFPEIASAPIITSFSSGAVLAAAFQLACYALLVSFALRLTARGMFYVAAVVFVGTLLDEVPKILRKKRVIIESFKPENYQAGSWAD